MKASTLLGWCWAQAKLLALSDDQETGCEPSENLALECETPDLKMMSMAVAWCDYKV